MCTVADLADYVYALGDDLLDSGAAAEMFAPITDDRGDQYGLGIGIESDPTACGHTGGVPGFETMMIAFPGEDIAVAVGLNAYDDDLYDVATRLFDRAIAIAIALAAKKLRVADPLRNRRRAISPGS